MLARYNDAVPANTITRKCQVSLRNSNPRDLFFTGTGNRYFCELRFSTLSISEPQRSDCFSREVLSSGKLWLGSLETIGDAYQET